MNDISDRYIGFGNTSNTKYIFKSADNLEKSKILHDHSYEESQLNAPIKYASSDRYIGFGNTSNTKYIFKSADNLEKSKILHDHSSEESQLNAPIKYDSYETISNEYKNIWSKIIKKQTHLNIIVSGKTGVGKSTLINAIFREDFAKTGIGKPVTQEIQEITKKDIPLTIYDTQGLELQESQQKKLIKDITDLIKEKAEMNDPNQMIHCIWYCINAFSERYEKEEIKLIQSFENIASSFNIPVIIVITKSYDINLAENLENTIRKTLKCIPIVRVVAKEINMRFPDGSYHKCIANGLENLIEVMDSHLPEIVKKTFQNVQVVSIKHKRKYALAALAAGIAATAAIGASPIPFSDCAILVPAEMTLLASITSIYGISIPVGFITTFLASTIGCGGATLLGRFAVTNILKLIPIVGTVVGAVVSGGTAGVLTAALGGAYIPIIEAVYKGEINPNSYNTEKFKNLARDSFHQELKLKKRYN